MTRVVVTGSAGVIGTVLMRRLPYALTGLDLPENDIADHRLLVDRCQGQDAVIHLAGDFGVENWQSDDIEPRNLALDLGVLTAAAEAGVRRVVLASSVHTDDWLAHDGPFAVNRALPVPTSPYGAHKLFVEGLGRHFAAHRGLEVVAVRFGGVGPEDEPVDGRGGRVYLSHTDLVSCIRAAVESPLPGGFAVFYAVSDNAGRMHDTANPLGWRPAARGRG